jgi:hypothetical protein
MENIYYHKRPAIQEHNVSADEDVLAIGRRRRQLPFKIDGNSINPSPETGRQRATKFQLPFQSRRQSIPLCETRRQVSPMVLVPAMHSLVIAVIIAMPMPMAFVAVLFVTVTVTVTLSIIILIPVFVAMFIVTAPVSMIFMLGKGHAGA